MSIKHQDLPFHFKIEGQLKILYSCCAFGIYANKNEFYREKIKEVLEKEEIRSKYPKETDLWTFYHQKYNFGINEEKRLFQETEAIAKEIADEFIELINICLKDKDALKNIEKL